MRCVAGADWQAEVSPILKTHRLTSIEHRWALQFAVVVRRCVQKSAPLSLCTRLSFTEHSHQTRGSGNSLRPFCPSSRPGMLSFTNRAPLVWHSLPARKVAQSVGPATSCPSGFLRCCQAFDRVDHRILLQSFYSLGVRGMSLQWLQSYLSARFIRVRVMDTLSAAASITSGVPQGSVLGPLLFLVHFRGIPEAMSPSQASLFADDTMAFQENCSGEQTSPCCDLGKHLGNLSSWAASNT